jgi:hypothetical protein
VTCFRYESQLARWDISIVFTVLHPFRRTRDARDDVPRVHDPSIDCVCVSEAARTRLRHVMQRPTHADAPSRRYARRSIGSTAPSFTPACRTQYISAIGLESGCRHLTCTGVSCGCTSQRWMPKCVEQDTVDASCASDRALSKCASGIAISTREKKSRFLISTRDTEKDGESATQLKLLYTVVLDKCSRVAVDSPSLFCLSSILRSRIYSRLLL